MLISKSSNNHNLFDPAVDSFSVQPIASIELEGVELHKLTPFQRALLVTDGTVTKFIEAYMLESVDIVLLKQEKQLIDNHAWLDLSQQTDIIAREVLLQGSQSHTIYAYANSILVPDRLPNGVRQGIETAGQGLGKILLSNQIENRREILEYGSSSSFDLPDSLSHLVNQSFLYRTYRIIVGGKPIMLINEKFPPNNQTPD